MNPTANDVLELQRRTKARGITIGEFKRVCREFRDRFGLTDRQALDLARNENVIEIMSELEGRCEDAPERAGKDGRDG